MIYEEEIKLKQENKRMNNDGESLATVRERERERELHFSKIGSQGITLIALVITVIVLIILAGVGLSFVLGDNGILKRAQDSSGAYKNKAGEEANALAIMNSYLETKYVGYYADIDGDGTVDGVIYADLAVGGRYSSWPIFYDITPETTGLKNYTVSSTQYDGPFGKKEVLTPEKGSTGKDRFYVMALQDIDGKQNGDTYCWYAQAYHNSNEKEVTSQDFGTGKTNTATMMEKWKTKAWGEQNTGSKPDLWGQIQTQVANGWFVPSLDEWGAFGHELGILYSNSKNLGLIGEYWSSSQSDYYGAWTAYAGGAGFGSGGERYTNDYHVRLSTTF